MAVPVLMRGDGHTSRDRTAEADPAQGAEAVPPVPGVKVRLRRDGVLWVVETLDGVWLAGLLCEAARAEYIKRCGYEVVE